MAVTAAWPEIAVGLAAEPAAGPAAAQVVKFAPVPSAENQLAQVMAAVAAVAEQLVIAAA